MKIAVVLIGLALCAAEVYAQQAPAKPDIDKGRDVAKKICVACHGENGNSTSSANPKLAGQIPEYMHKQLVNYKANSERKSGVMLGMAGGLSDADMRNVAAYYAIQQPKEGAAKNKETLALGRKLFRGGDASKGLPACAACHGATGGGIPAQFPRLAGQFAEYTAAQLKAFRADERTNDANRMMRGIASRMNDAEIGAVADYIAGLR